MTVQITLNVVLHPLIEQQIKSINNLNKETLIDVAQDLIEDSTRNCRFKEASDIALSIDPLSKCFDLTDSLKVELKVLSDKAVS